MTGTQLLWRRWAPEILLALSDGPKRFNRLLKLSRSGADWLISDRVLFVRLQELEMGGLARRSVDPGPPIRVHYELTHAGRQFVRPLAEMQRIAEAQASEAVAS